MCLRIHTNDFHSAFPSNNDHCYLANKRKLRHHLCLWTNIDNFFIYMTQFNYMINTQNLIEGNLIWLLYSSWTLSLDVGSGTGLSESLPSRSYLICVCLVILCNSLTYMRSNISRPDDIDMNMRALVCTNKAPFDRLDFLILFNHILTDTIDFGLFHKLSLTYEPNIFVLHSRCRNEIIVSRLQSNHTWHTHGYLIDNLQTTLLTLSCSLKYLSHASSGALQLFPFHNCLLPRRWQEIYYQLKLVYPSRVQLCRVSHSLLIWDGISV